MLNESLVVLREYNTPVEAEIAKSILESAGIYAIVGNEYMPVGAIPVQLMVRSEDRERAERMLLLR